MVDTPSSRPIIELRQYTLHPGQRDVLIDLFEKEFIETQEVLGMQVIGTFRDLDRPDRFVWIRSFRDMGARAEGLNAFYTGPVWQKHRNAANATMIDSDNVLLLHSAHADSGFPFSERTRPPKGATAIPDALVIATIYSFDGEVGAEFVEFFDNVVKPELRATGATVCAEYLTEASPNNFPRLPVREKDRVFVWFSAFANRAEYEQHLAKRARSAKWRTIAAEVERRMNGPTEVLRLQPTARSAFPADFARAVERWQERTKK